MATGKTGSERMYPNPGNASKGDPTGGPGGRTYPGHGARPMKTAKVKKQTTGSECMPPGPSRPSCSCNTEYRQKGSKREYPQ